MPKPVVKRSLVEEDVLVQAFYIARDNPEAAERYLDAVEEAFRALGQTPGLGGPYRNPRLKGLRRLILQGFSNHLIFYLDLPEHIDILRVLHAARDLQTILDEEGR